MLSMNGGGILDTIVIETADSNTEAIQVQFERQLQRYNRKLTVKATVAVNGKVAIKGAVAVKVAVVVKVPLAVKVTVAYRIVQQLDVYRPNT